ncbi:MAG: hypothetical protein WCI43_09240 [Candidatus Firestonebacteria bacterium]
MRRMFMTALVLFLSFGVFAAEVTTFTVTEKGSVGPLKRYVRGGIPLPDGKLKSLEKVAVLDASGKEIPAELTVLNTWFDNSMKWVLVEFSDVFEPGQDKKYSLAEVDNKMKLINQSADFSKGF